ncbi:MAG TPA: FAD-binding protein [Firmicutes bacterium]|nr:FAD-binding protein [Bacillota bacterium]
MSVIVIGGGGGALLAALAAREHGADVLLLSKSLLGKGNCTAVSGAGFTAAVGGLSPRDHFEVTMKTGRNLSDRDLVNAFASEGARALERLAEYGVDLTMGKGRATAGIGTAPDAARGTSITRPLVKKLRESGVVIREQVMATSILMGERGPRAVEAFDYVRGCFERLSCTAVVVATGGGGSIYDLTDNPPHTTGDGYVLLAEIGVPLRDMEFVQFYPLGFDQPGLPRWMIDLGVIDHCKLVDSDGEEFLKRRLAEWGIPSGRKANDVARDKCAIEVALAKRRGKVLLHLEELDLSSLKLDWEKSSLGAIYKMYLRYLSKEGIAAPVPVEVGPIQHYFCGGAVIAPDGSTGIPGVYACGEVTGGVDGANRVGGNALTNLAVFGPRAGASAAAFASREKDLETTFRQMETSHETGESCAALQRRLRLVCQRFLGPLRDERGLNEALRSLEELEYLGQRVTVATPRDTLQRIELRNMIVTAKMVATAALLRKESRGVHYRTDFPVEDPLQSKPILIRLNEGTLTAEWA